MRVCALVCLLFVGFGVCENYHVKSYRGHHVISTQAANEKQLAVLQGLRHNYDLVFLREPSLVMSTELVVSPEQRGQVMDTLREAAMTVTVLSTDLQAQIDADMSEILTSQHEQKHFRTDRIKHNAYRNLSQVEELMFTFQSNYPDLVDVKTLNHRTHEQRTVLYMEIGKARDSSGNPNKPVIFIETLAHAREWATTASMLYVIDTMLKGYEEQVPNMVRALTDFTWIIIPVVNPDGYHYSWTGDRLWRKNRRTHNSTGHRCPGVDLNRNYDMKFGKIGTSNNCYDEIYLGESPFSEPETKNVRDLFLKFKPRIVSFLSVHAYSQLLLHPWAYTRSMEENDLPPNLKQLVKVGELMQDALQSNGKRYKLGTAYSVLGYAAAGGSFDWALQEKPGILSYCYELRPASWWEGGFQLPKEYIVPTGEELLRSLLVLAEQLS